MGERLVVAVALHHPPSFDDYLNPDLHRSSALRATRERDELAEDATDAEQGAVVVVGRPMTLSEAQALMADASFEVHYEVTSLPGVFAISSLLDDDHHPDEHQPDERDDGDEKDRKRAASRKRAIKRQLEFIPS